MAPFEDSTVTNIHTIRLASRTRNIGSALTALLFLMSSLVSAAESGFYVGGNLGVSMIDDTASTALIAACEPFCFPDELSINGRAFDSNETAWGAVIGWHAIDWLALEIGYTDLGNTGQEQPFSFIGLVPGGITGLPPGIGPGIIVTTPAIFPTSSNNAALDIEEWSFSAKFTISLFSDLSANWLIGITRVDFESQGSLTIPVIVSLSPTITELITFPFASPESETGFIWGFGFAWDLNERFSVELGYRKHETQVIEVETVSLGITFAL